MIPKVLKRIMDMKCKYILYFLGILLFISCSTQPKIENIPKTGYKDEFSKTFVNLLDSLSYAISDKEKVIGFISVKKYVPDFYMLKTSWKKLEFENAITLNDYNNDTNNCLYYNDVLFLLNIEPQDLSKFHEFDLKENYKIKITRINKKNISKYIIGNRVDLYSMTDIKIMYQQTGDLYSSWDFEDGFIDIFRKRINGELKPNKFPERPKREKEEDKSYNYNPNGIEEAKKRFQKILDKEK